MRCLCFICLLGLSRLSTPYALSPPSLMTTSTAAHRLASVHLPVQTSGYLGIFLRIPQGNQGRSLARQLHKSEQNPTYGGALQRLAVGHGGAMHDDCIARGSLVRGILCKVRLNPSFFRDSRLLCNICLCTSKVTYIVLRTSMLLGRPELNWPDVLRTSPPSM